MYTLGERRPGGSSRRGSRNEEFGERRLRRTLSWCVLGTQGRAPKKTASGSIWRQEGKFGNWGKRRVKRGRLRRETMLIRVEI